MRVRLLLVPLVALALSSCRLEIGVDVGIDEDGSGRLEVVVGLDDDAVDRLGGDLRAVLVTDDLTAAGWTVAGPRRDSDGITRLRVARQFGDPSEASAIFEDIAGTDGPFQDFRVDRRSSLGRTEWDFSGRLDFGGGLEAFGDSALAAELDGLPLGRSLEEIEADLGEPLQDAITVEVVVHLPGRVSSNASETTADGARWEVGFGERTLALDATGEERRTGSLVAAGITAMSAGALMVYGVVRLVSRVRRPRAT